jgi:hypothetical protein
MTNQKQSLEAIQDIRKMMERSSRFISLSGLSGVSAGIFALVGSWIAHNLINKYYDRYNARPGYDYQDFKQLTWSLVGVAMVILILAILSALYFTWRKASRNQLPIWDHTSRKLLINMCIPIAAGGIFVFGLLRYDEWRFVAPVCLIFYGLALVNASKYTLSEIRYVGLIEIILGLINMWWIGYGLYFWAMGFGLLHIVYGLLMWRKYDMNERREDVL